MQKIKNFRGKKIIEEKTQKGKEWGTDMNMVSSFSINLCGSLSTTTEVDLTSAEKVLRYKVRNLIH